MALRTSKISSEILQTCNRLFSAEVTSAKFPATQTDPTTKPFRYKIANTEKPQSLPTVKFDRNDTQFAELQPAASPEFRFEKPPKWAEQSLQQNPFPNTIKPKNNFHMFYSDQQKAEDKMFKFKMTNFNTSSRSYSTMGRRFYGRAPADNNSAAHCKQKLNKCTKLKKRECKITNKDCPRVKLENCVPSKGSNCKLHYLDPHCHKKFAPYPSYSESCAEQLPDDPSECQQCPWRTCDGADTIEPGKPVRNKRNYSTSCARHLEASGGVVIGPLLPPPLVQCGKCGLNKPPCRQPPGPCEVRRKIEEKKKHEKTKRIVPKNKKASNMVLTGSEATGGLLVNPYTLEPMRINMDETSLNRKESWLDLFEGPEVFMSDKKKNKFPHCQKKKKPKRPKGPTVDSFLMSQQEMELSGKKGGKTKKIKGDEGHPPPCPEKGNNSQRCPENLKKPKYQKRPMDRGYYKKPEDPYTPTNGK